MSIPARALDSTATPLPTRPYRMSVPAYDSGSLCRTLRGHALCGSCRHSSLGPVTPKHFLTVPATSLSVCPCYARKAPDA